MDAVLDHDFVLDGSRRLIYLAKKGIGHSDLPPSHLILQERVLMLPRSEVVCEVAIVGPSEKVKGIYLFTPSKNLPIEVKIHQFVGETTENQLCHVHIENSTLKPVKLPKGFKLGTVDFNCQMVGKIAAIDKQDSPREEKLSDILSQIDVEKEYAIPVKKLLEGYIDMLATTTTELGSSDVIKHKIDTQGEMPIRQRPYRATPKQKEEINRQVSDMLKAEIIRPSNSPWAAPVILVEKKTGDQRFCVDYRKLNKVTKKDSYPLPRIDETLDSLYGMKYFTTLDLLAGYWQIELDEEAKEKTAFITGNELYEFNRMPFGLCNAPATFQRLMNRVLRTVLGKKALVYLDDVIVYSDSLENHLTNLEEVLDLVRKAGLKIKISKCKFVKKSVEFLGHIISESGISPDPSKIESIKNYQRPQSIEDIRSFLGLAGYYRRFIPHFGTIAQPLTKKTHKELANKLFEWTSEDQKAFDTLRTCLITPPILAYPDFSQEFLLFTDASNYGVGAVLSQVQDKKEVVIAYASRQLKKPEINYATIEKEALAVIFAIKQFRHYLSDTHFTVISDHRPLQWLENQKDHSGRLGRWAILLSNLNYKIVYRPGRIHQNADCLSRLKVSAISIGKENTNICKEQANDWLCTQIRNYLETGVLLDKNLATKLPIWAKEIEFFNVIENILYRFEPSTKNSRRNEVTQQLVLPLTLRPNVLKSLHDDPSAGHLAFLRTYLRVKSNYYWPSMKRDIKNYCETCITCAANTKNRHRVFLYPHEAANAPFEVIGIDFVGPIRPMSTAGNSHILVITDYFSKWVEAVALPNQLATTTADALYKTVIQRHGPPKVIISDRGTNFTSKLFQYFCEKFKIDHRLTTAYNPASNGETERYNRTLASMLRKLLKDGQHQDWEELLGDVCFAYRNSVHSSTLETPYYLVHGRDPNVAINQYLQAVPEKVISQSDYLERLSERLRFSFAKAKEENEKARRRQKEQYDKRAKALEYKIGDKVLLDVRVVANGDSKKFTSKFKGPYRVIRVFKNFTVDIADNSYKIQKVHMNRLKPLLETMLWTDEACPAVESPRENPPPFRRSIAIQTDAPLDPYHNVNTSVFPQQSRNPSESFAHDSTLKESESPPKNHSYNLRNPEQRRKPNKLLL